MIAKTTGNYILRLKPNTLYIITEMKFQFQSLISILTTCFDFLKNREPLTQFKIYFMTQFSLTVPGVSPYPRCPQVTDAPGLFLCPRFLLKFAATCFYLDLCTVWCLARPAFVENDRQQVIHLKIDVVGAFVVVRTTLHCSPQETVAAVKIFF